MQVDSLVSPIAATSSVMSHRALFRCVTSLLDTRGCRGVTPTCVARCDGTGGWELALLWHH